MDDASFCMSASDVLPDIRGRSALYSWTFRPIFADVPPDFRGRSALHCQHLHAFPDGYFRGGPSNLTAHVLAFQTERVALIDARYLRTPNTLRMKSLFQSKDSLTCSNLAKLCRIIMERFKRAGSKPAGHTTILAETMVQNSQNQLN